MISPGDLRSPSGDLGDSLFPGESSSQLDARIQGYIDEGVAKATASGLTGTDIDEAAKAWAYHRAYRAVHVRLLNSPSSVEMSGQGSKATLWSQIESFGKMADAYLSEYRTLLPAAVVGSTEILPGTTAVRTTFDF